MECLQSSSLPSHRMVGDGCNDDWRSTRKVTPCWGCSQVQSRAVESPLYLPKFPSVLNCSGHRHRPAHVQTATAGYGKPRFLNCPISFLKQMEMGRRRGGGGIDCRREHMLPCPLECSGSCGPFRLNVHQL